MLVELVEALLLLELEAIQYFQQSLHSVEVVVETTGDLDHLVDLEVVEDHLAVVVNQVLVILELPIKDQMVEMVEQMDHLDMVLEAVEVLQQMVETEVVALVEMVVLV